MMRRRRLTWPVLVLGLISFLGGWFASRLWQAEAPRPPEPIRVGILHSLSGPMAASEKPVVDALLLAIDELNGAGGLLGRPIEPVVVDGRSNDVVFARQAEKLIVDSGVEVIFGCWTSSARKAVKTVVERHDSLLFYPLQYEGMEKSANIVYTGSSPNQQIVPAVNWAFANLGHRFFLIGSDYVFPRAANEMIKDLAGVLGAEIVGEEYVGLAETDFREVVERIIAARPEVILNTINGTANRDFLEALHARHDATVGFQLLSFSVSESELAEYFPAIKRGDDAGGLIAHFKGNYGCWSYFQSLDNPQNTEFLQRFGEKYGARRSVGDPMVSAYSAVHLWAGAVTRSGSSSPLRVRQTLPGMVYQGPQGFVAIDRLNNHTWKSARIGKVGADGQFDIVWQSPGPIGPELFPVSRMQQEWQEMLEGLYTRWGDQWSRQQ